MKRSIQDEANVELLVPDDITKATSLKGKRFKTNFNSAFN